MEDATPIANRLPIEQFLTYRLTVVQNKLNERIEHIVHDLAHMTLTQWRIVAMIGANMGSTSTELTRASGIDKGLFSRRLKGLVAEGLVEVKTDELDNRVHHLRLTDIGQSLFEQTLPHVQAWQSDLRKRLREEEVEAFFDALDKIEAAVDGGEL